MGALEALNGVILIGLTTALMYGLIQSVWPVASYAVTEARKRGEVKRSVEARRIGGLHLMSELGAFTDGFSRHPRLVDVRFAPK